MDHVFLPQKLLEAVPADELHTTEVALLQWITKIIKNFDENEPLDATKHLFQNMADIYGENDLNYLNVAAQLDNLQAGQMFGIFLREQNCGVLIYSPKDITSLVNRRIISTFQSSVENKVISGNSGDIQVNILCYIFL